MCIALQSEAMKHWKIEISEIDLTLIKISLYVERNSKK